jgi:TPP-dependent pyruvate/acetoin dehydrogenase alpha subunit
MPKLLGEKMKAHVNLYKKLYLIRASEIAIQKHYPSNDMKTPMHMSAGSEAIAAGVCEALGQDDQILCSYRSHSCYLAKTGDTDGFFAEMYGKVSGCGRGKAGSMHVSRPEFGHIMSSAIVASHIPISSGVAFANKIKNNDKICSVFFGDGALDEGVFWETLNASCVMSLPILFICEDNDFAVHTQKSQRQGYKNIDNIIKNFDCNSYALKPSVSTDATAVFRLAKKAIKAIRTNGKPSFVRIPYYRYLEHVGINEDFHRGYRPKEEYYKWKEKDPIAIMRNRLPEHIVSIIEKEIDDKINASIKLAQSAEYADNTELYKDVFYG